VALDSSAQRGWWLLVVCSSIAALPGALLSMAYTFYVVERQPSSFVISIALVLPASFNALSKVWGFMADYYGSRKLFISAGWLSSALTLLIPLLKPSLTTVLLASVLGSALWSVGAPALVAEVMSYGEPGTRLGVWRSVGDGLYLLGTLCAGLLYGALGLEGILALCLVTYLATGLAIAVAYRGAAAPRQGVGGKPLREFVEDLKVSLLEERAAMLGLATLISWFSIWSIEGLARAKVLRALGSEPLYSLVSAVATAVEMVSAPLIGRLVDERGPLLVAVAGVVMHVVTGAVIAYMSNPLPLSIVWCVPFGYMLTCSLYVAYARLVRGLADAVGTCNTLISAVALPATLAASLADLIGADHAIMVLTLSSIPAIPLLLRLRE